MTLTASDKQSALWAKLMKHYKERHYTLLLQNAGVLPVSQKDRICGQIEEIGILLAMDKDRTMKGEMGQVGVEF